MVERKLDPISTREPFELFLVSKCSLLIAICSSTQRYRAHREQVEENQELMRVSAKGHTIFPRSARVQWHTFAVLSVCTILSVIVAAVVLHLTVTVAWASRSAAIIVVAVSVITTTVILSWRIVATSGRRRSSASARRCAITAASVGARFGWTIATPLTAGVETPGGRGRCACPLGKR